MNRKECFYATIKSNPVGRSALWLDLPVTAASQGLYKQIGISSYNELKDKYNGKASCYDGVDTKELLVSGSPKELNKKVQELKEIFPTGLIVTPEHEAILTDISTANVEAMFIVI